MDALQLGVAFLIDSANSDGGWGYTAGTASVVEATAAALLALRQRGSSAPALAAGIKWLASAQNHDGGWGLNAEDKESGWQTAWAMLALSDADVMDEATEKGEAWLLEVRSWTVDSEQQQADTQDLLGFDPNLRAWPWQPGEANWVEPTALAMLSLSGRKPSADIDDRLAEAVRYLVDRRCRQGGWNVGNPIMLGAELSPRTVPTAWALLALKLAAPDAIIAADIEALRDDMYEDGGALALAWGLLALRELGECDAYTERLHSLQTSDGGWNDNPYHTAVALLALQNSRAGLFD